MFSHEETLWRLCERNIAVVVEHQGLRVAVLTRRGSGRDINQDRVVVNDTVVDSDRRTTTMFAPGCPSVVAVLDGLGGHPAGDIAAALAAEVIAQGSSEVETSIATALTPQEQNPRSGVAANRPLRWEASCFLVVVPGAS